MMTALPFDPRWRASWRRVPRRLTRLAAMVAWLVPATLSAQTPNSAEEARKAAEEVATAEKYGPPPAIAADRLTGADSVMVSPGETYPAGFIHRFFFGDLNRDLWLLEFEVPVLSLDSVGGGLEVDELSGGKQTVGLRFDGRDGLPYQFRSIVKSAARALPPPLRSTLVKGVFQDQMAAQFPLSAMVVAEFLEAVDVLVAKPRPVVMPDDPRLGEFREIFAGRLGWIEVRPNEREGDRPGFAGSRKVTGGEALLEELRDDPHSYVNQRKMLRARLVDMLVGDWDRHIDQWRWARFDEGDRVRWDPIPRDRDWALAHIDGLLPRITAIYFPKYVGFRDEYPDVERLHWSAQFVDRTFLDELEREEFEQITAEVVGALTDSVIDRAVDLLPPSYQEKVGADLRRALRDRRDHLPDISRDFYELLAQKVDVFGTDEVDSLYVARVDEGTVLEIWAPREGGIRLYRRVFDPDDTDEVRVYLRGGDDIVTVRDAPSVRVRVVTGAGDDIVRDQSRGDRLFIYDSEGDNDFEVGEDAFVTASDMLRQDSIRSAYTTLNLRDWGSSWIPRPELWYTSQDDLYFGLGMTRYGYGFGFSPYRSRFTTSLVKGAALEELVGLIEVDRAVGNRGWGAQASVDFHTGSPVRYFGPGNEVPAPVDHTRFKTRRHRVDISTGVRFQRVKEQAFDLGITWSHRGRVDPGAVGFDSLVVYGEDRIQELGFEAHGEIDHRDSWSFPTKGHRVALSLRAAPPLFDLTDSYGTAELVLSQVFGSDGWMDPVLALHARGQTAIGAAPYYRRPTLGDWEILPGYDRGRFVGDHAASFGSVLQLKLFDVTVVTDLDVGVHGLVSTGRVWLDGEASNQWHRSLGGGVWLKLPTIDRGVSLTFADGDAGLHTYLGFGMILR